MSICVIFGAGPGVCENVATDIATVIAISDRIETTNLCKLVSDAFNGATKCICGCALDLFA